MPQTFALKGFENCHSNFRLDAVQAHVNVVLSPECSFQIGAVGVLSHDSKFLYFLFPVEIVLLSSLVSVSLHYTFFVSPQGQR